jgi:hypothetical protein
LDALPANIGWGGNGAYSAGGTATNGIAGSSGIVVLRYVNAPVITLSTSTIAASVGTAITNLTVTNTGGAATFSVSPSLPSGLGINSSTGVVSGTPSGVTSSTTYTITASNTSGSVTATFSYSAVDAACSLPTPTSSGGYSYVAIKTVGSCSWAPPTGVTAIDLLVVAGGGGGGSRHAGGGGAGGLINATGVAINGSVLTITVGAGGAAGTNASRRGGTGGSSVVSTLTALGGTGGCQARATTCSNSAQATSLAAANGGIGGAGGASGRGGGGSNKKTIYATG